MSTFNMSEKNKRLIEKFCKKVNYLEVLYSIQKELFENEKNTKILEKSDHYFFYIINNILVERILLEVRKITDPSGNKDKENLSVNYLVDKIDWPVDIKSELENIQTKTNRFRNENVKGEVDKKIAHNDLKIILEKVRGEKYELFPIEEFEDFLKSLKKFCNLCYKPYFNKLYFIKDKKHRNSNINVIHSDLISKLEIAIKYDYLIKNLDNKKDQDRLFDMFDEININEII